MSLGTRRRPIEGCTPGLMMLASKTSLSTFMARCASARDMHCLEAALGVGSLLTRRNHVGASGVYPAWGAVFCDSSQHFTAHGRARCYVQVASGSQTMTIATD